MVVNCTDGSVTGQEPSGPHTDADYAATQRFSSFALGECLVRRVLVELLSRERGNERGGRCGSRLSGGRA